MNKKDYQTSIKNALSYRFLCLLSFFTILVVVLKGLKIRYDPHFPAREPCSRQNSFTDNGSKPEMFEIELPPNVNNYLTKIAEIYTDSNYSKNRRFLNPEWFTTLTGKPEPKRKVRTTKWISNDHEKEREYRIHHFKAEKRQKYLLSQYFQLLKIKDEDLYKKQTIFENKSPPRPNANFRITRPFDYKIFESLHFLWELFFSSSYDPLSFSFSLLPPLSSSSSSSSFLSSSPYFFALARTPQQSANSFGKSSGDNSQRRNLFRRSFSEHLHINKAKKDPESQPTPTTNNQAVENSKRKSSDERINENTNFNNVGKKDFLKEKETTEVLNATPGLSSFIQTMNIPNLAPNLGPGKEKDTDNDENELYQKEHENSQDKGGDQGTSNDKSNSNSAYGNPSAEGGNFPFSNSDSHSWKDLIPRVRVVIEPMTTLKLRKRFYPFKTTIELGADYNTQLGVWQFRSSWEDRIVGGRLSFKGRELQFSKNWVLGLDKEDIIGRIKFRAGLDLSSWRSYARCGFRTERVTPVNVQEGFSIRRKVPLDGSNGHAKLEVRTTMRLPDPEVEFSSDKKHFFLGTGDVQVSLDELNLMLEY